MSEGSLGERLRSMRERQGINQEALAKRLGISRSQLGQIESGEKKPGLSLLEELAFRLGCSPRSLMEGSGDIDPLMVMLRANPQLQESDEARAAIQKCVRLGREVAYLEGLLSITRESVSPSRLFPGALESRIDAIRQGEKAADHERRRLGLGRAPIGNMIALLETEGFITSQVRLDEGVSGVSVLGDRGLFIFVNRDHPTSRRRFSLAHEYAHALLDLRDDTRFIVSLDNEGSVLREVRANAFAAAFLAPRDGCSEFILSSGKGRDSRVSYNIPSGDDVIQANERNLASEQSVQSYDILLLARHFGISPQMAAYRLSNVGLIDDAMRQRFLDLLKSGSLSSLVRLIPEPAWEEDGEDFSFSSRLLGLALEAHRREMITTGRLFEIAGLVDVAREDVERALVSLEPLG